MRIFAKVLAALLLALAPLTWAAAQPGGRDGRRVAERRGERSEGRAPARQDRQPAYRAPAYRGQPYPPPSYPAPYPGVAAYPPAPVYGAPPPGYYPPPPGYAPDSLGAGWAQQQDQARSGVRQGRLMALGQVVQRLRQAAPGRLLDAGLEPGPDGRPAYRVRWAATGGRRIDFIVDATTGAILARSGY